MDCILRSNNFFHSLLSLKKNTKIVNSATREVQSVMGFLKTKTFRPAEIHRQSVETKDEGSMKEQSASKWCLLFREGGNNLRDGE